MNYQTKKIGYARISTKGQSLQRQLKLLRDAGVDDLYSEVSSASATTRPALQKALGLLRRGDTLVVAEWDRLSRNLLQGLALFEQIHKAGASLVVLDRPSFDFSGPQGLERLTWLAQVAQEELERIRRRSIEGLETAKYRGVRLGRRSKLKPAQVVEARKMLEEGRSTREIGALFRVSHSTISRLGSST